MEFPKMFFSDATESTQTQVIPASPGQIQEDHVTCYLDTIELNIMNCNEQVVVTNPMDEMNATLSTPLTDGAIELLKGMEMKMKDMTV